MTDLNPISALFQATEKMIERDSWPWAFFGDDGKVYDQPPEHVRFRAKRVPPLPQPPTRQP